MAHKKGAGSTKNGRDSNSKRLGVKKFGGEYVLDGQILIRQRSLKVLPGRGVSAGRDNTLFAKRSGVIKYSTMRNTNTKIYKKIEIIKYE
jgi:large subunit ribosomal protein L27